MGSRYGLPIIAHTIERLCRGHKHFVTRREIVGSLMQMPGTRKLIEAGYGRTKAKKSIEKYAGNMVDWFSQRWTVGEPKWFQLFKGFERSDEKIEGCWAYKPIATAAIVVYPDEIDAPAAKLPEGAAYKRLVNSYERNPLARQLCIKRYGAICCICGFSFGATYGPAMEGFIHVHHLLLLSAIGEKYEVDPEADLRPVCPNCHAVIHSRRSSPFTIEEVRSMLPGKSR